MGRKARLLEVDPAYCDTIVRRWERFTGKQATLAATGQGFSDVEEQHLAERDPEDLDPDNDVVDEGQTGAASADSVNAETETAK